MKMKIWYAVRDNGDGSASVCFFKTQEAANKACDSSDPDWDDAFNQNEGGPCEIEIEAVDLHMSVVEIRVTGISFEDA